MREYFTWEESVNSSTFRELLGVFRCLQALVHLRIYKFVVLQVDAPNLLSIVNGGSNKLAINKHARELFWFSLVDGSALTVEWVPREKNAFADEMSNFPIPDDWILAHKKSSFFRFRGGGFDVWRDV